MFKTLKLILLFTILKFNILAQSVGIGTTQFTPDAILDVRSTSSGILIPRMTNAQRNAISSPPTGSLIYQTDATAGFYYYPSGGPWTPFGGTGWSILGNASTVDGTNFLGTTDNIPFNIRVNNVKSGRIDPNGNTAFGYQAFFTQGAGAENIAVGRNALYTNGNGFGNIAVGDRALYFNSTGQENTAVGYLSHYGTSGANGSWNTSVGGYSMYSNNGGSYNTAIGYFSFAGGIATTGNDNTAIGYYAMQSPNNSINNVAVGSGSLQSLNANNNNNAAVGYRALRYVVGGTNNVGMGAEAAGNGSTGGSENVLLGYRAGYGVATATLNANRNTVVGAYALYGNRDASDNIAIGHNAMYSQSYNNGAAFSTYNIALGIEALYTTNSNNGSNGIRNTAIGWRAMQLNTTGQDNIAIGFRSLQNSVSGNNNLAIGYWALKDNTASDNMAIGYEAGSQLTSGIQNVAIGTRAFYGSLGNAVTSSYNTALGYEAMKGNGTGANTLGGYNTAIGNSALYGATSSSIYNTAVGKSALGGGNLTSSYNTAVGAGALNSAQSGANNTAVGYQALLTTDAGGSNTAVGYQALYGNSAGASNTAVGYLAGQAGTPITTGSNNTFIGNNAQSNAAARTNATAVGNAAIVTADNSAVIGNNAVTAIGGFANWANLSDGRFKTNITENVPGLDFINKLNPVTYTLDMKKLSEFLYGDYARSYMADNADALNKKSKITYSGFIAQEVEKAAQQSGYNFSGITKPLNNKQHYALSYADFVVPLTKAVQELSAKNNELEAEIQNLKKANSLLTSQIKLSGNSVEQEARLSKAESEIAELKKLLYTKAQLGK